MGKKKLGLSSLLLKFRDTPPKSSCQLTSSPSRSSSSWPWPSCGHPKTNSFRDAGGGTIYKTVNSVYFDSADSCFTRWSSEEEQDSFSTVSEEYCSGAVGEPPSEETVVRGLRSDRLFFEPGGTSSILEEANNSKGSSGAAGTATGPEFFSESVALAMESEDPYRDFRTSMEEMVAAHGLKDWERLEELLLWYLRVNGKKTHGFIVGAFVDLLVAIVTSPAPSSSSINTTTISPSSSSSSSNISFEIEEIIHDHKEVVEKEEEDDDDDSN